MNRLSYISDLAESIAEENISKGKVNLTSITQKKQIRLIYGHYGDFFLGELVHDSNKFYIHINLDLLLSQNSLRARFTLSHELGHFFIDEHRNKLKNGESLSHTTSSVLNSNKIIEMEANHFASNLLMPKTQFIEFAKKTEPGLNSILSLSKRYSSSIECTTIHYTQLNIVPCIFFKWDHEFNFQYAKYNNSFAVLTGIKGKPGLRIHKDYVKEILSTLKHEGSNTKFIEGATTISKWLCNYPQNASTDRIGLEQTIKLGEYGGITILLFA